MGRKNRKSFWLGWKQEVDPQMETEEADRWSCSSTDSLRVKLEPPTADGWTAASFGISSATFLIFFPLLFFCFVAAGGVCTELASAAAGGETASRE